MSCGKECENCGQVGGDGYAMSMTENIAGQPVVEAYNCCDNPSVPDATVADATNQVGGGVNPFNFIINPVTGARLSLFSSGGKALLKNMIRQYKAGGSSPEDETKTGDVDADKGGPEPVTEGSEAGTEGSEPVTEGSKPGETEPGAPTGAPTEGDGTTGTEEGDETKTGTEEGVEVDVLRAANEALEKADNFGNSPEDSKEALDAANKFANASEETGVEDAKDAQEKLRGVVSDLEKGLEGKEGEEGTGAPAPEEGKEKGESGLGGGAPAEMADAFGEDYFNTEADALRGSWD